MGHLRSQTDQPERPIWTITMDGEPDMSPAWAMESMEPFFGQ